MLNQFSRTELLIGKDNVEKLNKTKVAIFGIGGVGSYVVEALARTGIGEFALVDNDLVSLTNINRQIVALHSTIGMPKVDVAKSRILDINPKAKVETYKEFFLPETVGIIDKSVDYIIDAIDTVTAKIELVMRANKFEIPIISSMGTGNKLDPTKLEVSDIFKTSVCPLAKVMRKELKARGIKKLKVVYSKEDVVKCDEEVMNECISETSKSRVPGSVSFVPSVAGLIIASEVIKDICKK